MRRWDLHTLAQSCKQAVLLCWEYVRTKHNAYMLIKPQVIRGHCAHWKNKKHIASLHYWHGLLKLHSIVEADWDYVPEKVRKVVWFYTFLQLF